MAIALSGCGILFVRILALSVIALQCHLSQGERQETQWLGLGSPFLKDFLRPEGDVALSGRGRTIWTRSGLN